MEEIIKSKKIAFCITCMNRLHHLKETLEKNMLDNHLIEDVEFILLDYNSQDGLDEWVHCNMKQYIDNGLLVYYKTIEPVYYHRSHSRNMVFKLANAHILCNLDADNFLGEGFAAFMIEEFAKYDTIFYTSNYSSNDIYGRVCVKKQDFMAINGYNEAHMYITYINAYTSGVILLSKDYTFAHYFARKGAKHFSCAYTNEPDNQLHGRNQFARRIADHLQKGTAVSAEHAGTSGYHHGRYFPARTVFLAH